MEITKILRALKGNVLDPESYQLLKYVYKMQEKRINHLNQMKFDNTKLQENIDLLNEMVQRLQNDINRLYRENFSLKKKVERLTTNSNNVKIHLSEGAINILALYNFYNLAPMSIATLRDELGIEFSSLRVAAKELIDAGMIQFSRKSKNFFLTAKGENMIRKFNKNKHFQRHPNGHKISQ